MTTLSRRQALAMIGTAGAALALAPSFTLAADNTVICGWNSAFAPFSMERDGGMTGILVECVDELLGRRMGMAVRHRAAPWAAVQDMVRTGKVDALCTNPTEPRCRFMLFCRQPVLESLPAIFRAKDNPRGVEIDHITGLKGLRDFRQVDYAGNGWANETFPPDLHITWADTLEEAMAMVADGRADIFVGNTLAAMHAMAQGGLRDRIMVRELAVGNPSSFHFGLRLDYPDAKGVIERFSQALDEAAAEDSLDDIIQKYL
ncbi:MAG: transporter substrate-binding domain-containing protein [Pseudodesulfovibrio sp.]